VTFLLSSNLTLSISLKEIFEKGILSPLLVSSLIENPNPTCQLLLCDLSFDFGKSEILIVPLTFYLYLSCITALIFSEEIMESFSFFPLKPKFNIFAKISGPLLLSISSSPKIWRRLSSIFS